MLKKPKETPVTKDFRHACTMLAFAFLHHFGLSDSPDGAWWVGDEPGDVFCFQGGDMFTNTPDMVLALEHKLSWEEWREWYWQAIETDENMNPLPNRINLRSWIMGARPKENQTSKQ